MIDTDSFGEVLKSKFRKGEIMLDKQKIIAGICIVCGIALIAVPFYWKWKGSNETDMLLQNFKQNVEAQKDEENKEFETDVQATISEEANALLAQKNVIGIIEIEKLGIRYPIVKGCSSSELRYAIGHMSETAGIGKVGNCVLAGHNGSRYGTFFTHLNELMVGDVISLLNADGVIYEYEVAETFIVEPYKSSITKQGDIEELTLFTCANKGTMRFVCKCVPMARRD